MDNSYILEIANTTLANAGTAISTANNLFVGIGIMVALATIIVSVFITRQRKELANEILNKIAADKQTQNDLTNKLIANILDNKDILKSIVKLQEFKEQLDIAVSDQMELRNNLKKENIENLDESDKKDLEEMDIKIDDEKNLQGEKDEIN